MTRKKPMDHQAFATARADQIAPFETDLLADSVPMRSRCPRGWPARMPFTEDGTSMIQVTPYRP
jgi:hypothetical protein